MDGQKWIISSKGDFDSFGGENIKVSYHCGLRDGAKAVDENIDGHIHGGA